MRISTQMFYQRNLNNMLDNQGALSEQNMYMSQQKRVIYASDDPVAISTIQRLKQNISVGEQYIQNSDMADSANSLEDTALTQVTNILQRVRELTVTGGNGTYSEENREVIATELEGLLDQLVGVANTKDGNSQYIFSGYEVNTEPFQTNEFGTVEYHGDDGNRTYRVGSGVYVQGNDSGASVFEDIADGNGTFVSQGNINNTGSGVIDSGSVVDKNTANDFADHDYTIAISASGTDSEYAVYGLDNASALGNAEVKVTNVLDATAPIAGVYPATDSSVDISFTETSTGVFDVYVSGNPTPVSYDSTLGTTQTVTIDGISIDIKDIPEDGDTYSLTKFVEPTLYVEGQSIEFNGIKTEIKGNVEDEDSFTLSQSGTQSVFSTIQDTIDFLRISGEGGAEEAQRNMGLATSLLQIDNAMSNVTRVHTSVGSRMNTTDSQREATLDFNLTNAKTLSGLEDLDMAAAISEYQLQSTQLEISQQTFIQIQSLSLFNLL